MNNRNINLDLIKSIACIGVVGLHSVGMIDYTIYYLCTFAVPFFFMVNGYLMFKKEKVDYGYSLKKIGGLLKIVLFYNLLIMIPVMIFRHKIINPITFSLKSLVQQGYLWHFWFFGALMILYILLPLYHGFLKSHLYVHIGTVIVLLVACFGFTLYSSLTGYPLQAFVPQSLRVWTWLFYFLTGGLVCRMDMGLIGRKGTVILTVASVVLMIGANIIQKRMGLFIIHNRTAEFFYDEILVMLWVIISFILLLKINIPSGLVSAISFFSSTSLGIFIIHPLLLTAVNAVFEIGTPFMAVIVWILMVVLSCGISFIMSRMPILKKFVSL